MTARLGPNTRAVGEAVVWGVVAYVLTSVRIEMPGPVAFHTDLTELALLGCVLFLRRPWLTLIVCAIEALNVVPPATLALSFQTTFVMHAIAVPCAWYAHRALQRRATSHLALGLGWVVVVVLYYLVLLIPLLIVTAIAFIPPSLVPPITLAEVPTRYWRIARAVPYEMLLTASVTALTFVTLEELRRRRRIEAELREALASLRALVVSAPVAVVSVRPDGVVSAWNPAAERVFGIPAARAVGVQAPRLRPRDGGDGESLLTSLLAGTPLLGVEGVADRGGEAIPVSVFGAPLEGVAGAPAGAVLVVQDLREQVALRDAVQRSASMSALGQLVGGVAHELRNPLFGITATLDAFAPALARQPKLELMERTLRGQVEQIKTLMLDLLAYGRAGLGERATVGLDLPLGHALRDCAAQAAAAGVTIDVALPAALPPVSANAAQLQQALRNLIQNAIAFSARGGVVQIEGRVEAAADDGARGRIARLDVLDRGVGFTPADQPHVFEPFFSRRHGGTGLGLAIVQHVVEQHGGTVLAGNRDGGGAEMTVRLPVAAE